jgi:hypothetical protein
MTVADSTSAPPVARTPPPGALAPARGANDAARTDPNGRGVAGDPSSTLRILRDPPRPHPPPTGFPGGTNNRRNDEMEDTDVRADRAPEACEFDRGSLVLFAEIRRLRTRAERPPVRPLRAARLLDVCRPQGERSQRALGACADA